MSNAPLRVLVYVPVVWPDASRRRLVAQVKGLSDAAARRGGSVTLLATAADLAGQPIPWPTSVYRPSKAVPPAKYTPNSLPAATGEAFDQFTDLAFDHDVLFLPQPFGALPSDSRLILPRPLVLGLDDLHFDRHDVGARSDRFRRELDRLITLAAGFVFPTATARADLTLRYRVPGERAWVVPVDGTPIVVDAPGVRKRYGLPEKYVLAVGWKQPGGVLAKAAGEFAGDVPFVGVSEVADEPPFAGLDQRDAADLCVKALADAGRVKGKEWFDLGVADADDVPGLVLGATAVLAGDTGLAGPDWYTLAALASGVPVIYPNTPAFADKLGAGGRYAAAYTPTEPAELAGVVRAYLEHADAVRERATGAKAEFNTTHAGGVLLDTLAEVVNAPRAGRTEATATPVPRDKRVCWLISHTTLRDAEVPLMQSLGFEVYTNKVLPKGEDYRSGSMDFSWDAGLTLPTEVLDYFNQFNFYQTPFDEEMTETLNAYFGTVIVAAYPPVLKELTKHFRGRILLRAFGREHPATYASLLSYHIETGWRWERVWRQQHRFWLGACYEAIPPVEPQLMRDHVAMLPVAMPDWSLRVRGQWVGGDHRVFFVCPSIKTSPGYYGVIYERFKAVYGDFPHVIGGSQPIPLDDSHVTGFLTDEQYQKFFRTLQVMYYHSREPRHIHYHPLEAILYGMPVVYMRGGLMEAFDTGTQAGACYTDAEAREKLRRVLDGDQELIREIQESQVSILDIFLPEGVRDEWRRVFVDGVMRQSCIPDVACGLVEPLALPPAEVRLADGSAVTVLNRREVLAAGTDAPAEQYAVLELSAPPPPAEPAPPPPVEPPPPVIGLPTADPHSWRERGKRMIPARLQPFAKPVYHAARSFKWWLFGQTPPAPQLGVEAAPTHISDAPVGGVPEMVEETPPSPPPPVVSAAAITEWDMRFLTDPPPAPPLDPLPPVATAALNLFQLRQLVTRGPAAVVDPIGTLDPNFPIVELPTGKLVVGFSDLAWEYGDVYGPLTASATREAMLWCRMAAHVVFGSEADRRLGVQRYQLDPARTSVLPALTLTGGVDVSVAPLPADVRGRWSIPLRYVLGYHSPAAEANSLAVYQAVRLLVRRKVKLNAVVLTGANTGTTAGRTSERIEGELKKARERCGLLDGQNLFVVPGLPERERAGLELSASLSLVTARSGAGAARDVARAALARVPVIACDSPALTGRGDPTGGNLLIVPADDPVALADAVEHVINHPDETRERTERAYRAATEANSAERLREFDRLVAAVTADPLRATG
jgi:glycosyltransferase involved in cell wall biosynthesis